MGTKMDDFQVFTPDGEPVRSYWGKNGHTIELTGPFPPAIQELFDDKNFPPEQMPGEKASAYIQRVSEWAKENGVDPKNIKFEISLKELMA